LRAVRDDFASLRESPRILNCNAASRLFDERVFPYLHVDRALNDRPLSSVVVPTTLKERDALLNQLWLFQQEAFAPGPVPEFQKPDLAYVFNSGDTISLESELRQCFDESERLKQAFREPVFVNLGLTGEQDDYIRDYTKPAGRFGYKAGPNNQFFETLREFSLAGHFMFLMESDCLPIRHGWLGRLQRLLRDSERFWILGSAYRGRATIDESYKRHINGNAVYAVGDADFQVFVEMFWRPELERIVRSNPLVAYDCALELLVGEAKSQASDNPTWRLTQEIMHLIRYTDFVQNRSGNRDFWDTPPDLVRCLNRDSADTFFVHGKPIAEAVAAMRRAGSVPSPYDLKIPRLTPPTLVGAPKAVGAAPPSAPDLTSSETTVASKAWRPKILFLDHNLAGDEVEGEELTRSLLAQWPKDRLLLLCGRPDDVVHSRVEGNETTASLRLPQQRSALKARVNEYAPDVIFYRPAPNLPQMHALAMELVHERDAPLISCVTDNWPSVLAQADSSEFATPDAECRSLFRQSAGTLCSGDALGRALHARFSISCESFTNGIELQRWPATPKAPTDGVLIRYSGPLSEEGGVKSLVAVARAVEQLCSEGANVRLEINATKLSAHSDDRTLAEHAGTHLTTHQLAPDAYREWLCAADIVLIAYGFNDNLSKQARYVISPRLPELLCSGGVLFAIGPTDAATIDLLTALDCSHVHTQSSDDSIGAALRVLVASRDLRHELSQKAIAIARNQFGIHRIRDRFEKWVRDVTGGSQTNLALKIARNAERRRWHFRQSEPDNATPSARPPAKGAPPPALPALPPKAPNPPPQAPLGAIARPSSSGLPRILLFDLTRIGEATATGELKGSLFRDWPKDDIFQIFGGGQPTLGTYANGEIGKADVGRTESRSQLKARIAEFAPDLVVYRPVPDTPHLHALAMEVIGVHDVPLVTWIMDDWPAALKLRDAPQFEVLDRDISSLFQQSVGALSIGTAMSSAFSKRYGLEFEPIANGIERMDWDWSTVREPSAEVLIRYSGSLAQDMGLESLLGVAEAVEALGGEGLNVTFEIKTRKFWAERAGERFRGFNRTRVSTEELSTADYRKWLSRADIALICYNFDEASKAYVRYSVANKLPECLVSGAALLAIGPPDIATMDLLRSLDCSIQVETPSPAVLKRALAELVGSREKRHMLAQRAREVALDRFDMQSTRSRFVRWLTNAAQEGIAGKIARATKRFEQDLQHLQTRSQRKVSEADDGIRAGSVHVDQSEQLEQLSKKFGGIATLLQSQFTQNAG
jgi:glycosyltransferase involved in cell wall biosynthesis